ncbi:MAG: hypothetical protein IKE89_03325 [Bacilli bacterium]|nr:hypothetical protein [Bacilli bacterium]MBR2711482.1 hypothetical protein [Bacilli bacterium]
MKNKSSKLSKLERNRFSLFTDDLDTCIICKKQKNDINEIFRGRNRQNSMIYGLCIPLCRKCHTRITDNYELESEWKIKGQLKFQEYYNKTTEDFIEIFKRNYL